MASAAGKSVAFARVAVMGMAMPKLAVMGKGTLNAWVMVLGCTITVVAFVASIESVDEVDAGATMLSPVLVDCAAGNKDVVAMGATGGVGMVGALVSVDATAVRGGVAVGGSMMSDGARVVAAGSVGRGVAARTVAVMVVDGSVVLSEAAATDSISARISVVAAGVDKSVVATRSRKMG